jgi:hypothetical protein
MERAGRRIAPALLAWIVVAAGAALVPASAPAQDLDDTCENSGAPATTCVGMDKLAERASAECRRTAVASDQQCAALPVGRDVIAAELDAYESSWTHRALGLQYELAGDVGFVDAPWLGTHNSFNSTAEFPTLSHTDSNQQLSLVDQLRLDMRSLEIDVHWAPSVHAGGAQAPVVCHGRGGDELHAGCTSERLLGDVLAPVAEWLRSHPGQVLLLYIEDNLDGTEGQEAAAQVLQEQLGSLVYRPASASCSKLPLDVSRDDVLAAGAQVVIVAGCGAGSGWRATIFDWDGPHVETSTHGYGADCAPGDFDHQTYDTRLVRYF